MRREFVAAAVAAGMLAAVAVATVSWGAESRSYSARSGFSLEYGTGEASPGRADSEGEPIVPSSISVDGSGRIAIADPAKHRVALFDRAGSYLTSLPVEGVPVDAVVDGAGTAVLTAGGRLVLFGESGSEEATQQICAEVEEPGVKGLAFGRNGVWAETGRGESFKVALSGKRAKGVPETAQPGTRVRGAVRGDPAFECSYERGGRVVRHATEGAIDLTLDLGQEDLQGLSVAGVDRAGAFYVLCDIGTERGCRTECRKYSKGGVLLARFEVAGDRCWTARSTAVSADGVVYRLVADERCVTVTVYSAGGAS